MSRGRHFAAEVSDKKAESYYSLMLDSQNHTMCLSIINNIFILS